MRVAQFAAAHSVADQREAATCPECRLPSAAFTPNWKSRAPAVALSWAYETTIERHFRADSS